MSCTIFSYIFVSDFLFMYIYLYLCVYWSLTAHRNSPLQDLLQKKQHTQTMDIKSYKIVSVDRKMKSLDLKIFARYDLYRILLLQISVKSVFAEL